MKRPWVDTHVHIVCFGSSGRPRERVLEGLLDVLDRCDADVRLIINCIMILLNASIDHTPALRIRLRRTRTRALQWIVPEGRTRMIRTERQDNAIVLTVPAIRPWSVGWLRL